MANFQTQLKKKSNLSASKLQKDLFDFIKSIEKEVVALNVEQINVESKDINEKPIGFYSFATELITGGAKKQGDPFTGKDTGDWLGGFYMQQVGTNLRFGSTDGKTQDILKSDNWLSDDLFGLSDKDLKALIADRLVPFFIQNTKKIMEI